MPITYSQPGTLYNATQPYNGPLAPTTGNYGDGTYGSGTYGGGAATGVWVVDEHTIICLTGPHDAGLVDVVVTNLDGQSFTDPLAYEYRTAVAAPTLDPTTPISPVTGSTSGGDTITINGTGFVDGPGLGGQLGNGSIVNLRWMSPTQLVGITPSALATGLVSLKVTNPDGQSATATNVFTYAIPVAPPATYYPSAPSLSIDVYNASGVLVGAGPIRTATTWRSQPRLDRAGSFSFQMPAADARSAYLVAHNVVVARFFLNGQWTEIGRGIIDDIQVVAGSSPTMLTISGGDMLGQLAWRSVGAMTMATATSQTVVNPGITSLTPTDMHQLHINPQNGISPDQPPDFGYQQQAQQFDGSTGLPGGLTILDPWYPFYICYDDPYTSISWFLGTPANVNASWKPQYFNGTDWLTLPGFVDSTGIGGATLKQNGTMTWPLPFDWQPLEQAVCPSGDVTLSANYHNITGYWLRLWPLGVPGNVQVREVSIGGLVPTTQAVGQILGYANGLTNAVADAAGNLTGTPNGNPSLLWGLDATAGVSRTVKSNVFGQLQDDSVLAALIKLSELSNEHFRVGVGNKLVWLGQNTPSSGMRAIRPVDMTKAEANTAICAIEKLSRTTTTAQLCTVVIPYGAGHANERVTLDWTTRPLRGTFYDANGVPHSYAVDLARNIMVDLTAVGTGVLGAPGYGWIESVQEFNYISPALSLTPPSQILASNALYDAALVYLIHNCQPRVTFNLSVVGLKRVLYPGQTIRVIYKELTDVATVLDLDQTLIILEATNEILQQGYITTGMVLSQYPRWPLSDVELLAKMEQATRAMGRYPQPLPLGHVATPMPNDPVGAISSGQTLYTTGSGGVSARAIRS